MHEYHKRTSHLVLLRWQEFAIRSVAFFCDMPLRCRWQWRISVGVRLGLLIKNRWMSGCRCFEIVDRSGCPGMPPVAYST